MLTWKKPSPWSAASSALPVACSDTWHEFVGDVRQLGALADADQAHVEAAWADGRGQAGLIADVSGVRHRAFEARGVGVGQVVGHDLELALAGQHARDRDAL